MKTTSDVCKMFGITRKTLRGYIEIGLIRPTDKTGAGYWLYDDDSLKTLAFIQLMLACGYKRKEIKDKFVGAQEIDLKDEYKKAIEILEQKKEKISAMINSLKFNLDFMENTPSHLLYAIQKVNSDEYFQRKNFTERLSAARLSIDCWNKIQELGLKIDMNHPLIQAEFELICLGWLKKEDINSTDVQTVAARFEGCVWNYLIQEEDENEIEEILNGITDTEFENNMMTECMEFLEMLKEQIDMECGPGAQEFIENVLKQHKFKKPNKMSTVKE